MNEKVKAVLSHEDRRVTSRSECRGILPAWLKMASIVRPLLLSFACLEADMGAMMVSSTVLVHGPGLYAAGRA